MIPYIFIFKDAATSCGRVLTEKEDIKNPTIKVLNYVTNNIVRKYMDNGHRLQLLEAYPVTPKEGVQAGLPTLSRHTNDDHIYSYDIILGNIHCLEEKRIQIQECSNSPYVLNAKRIECVIDDYLQPEIINGWELMGIVCTGEQQFHTQPVTENGGSDSAKSAKNDEPEYVWVKVKDGNDCVNWIPARKSRFDKRQITSFIGLMFSETPEEDTRSFTDCPIPGYTVTVTK